MASARIDKCICGKHMIERANEGTCLWCGHGAVHAIVDFAYARNMAQSVSAVFGTPALPPAPDNVVQLPTPTAKRSPILWDQDGCATAAVAHEQRTGSFPSAYDWQRPQARGEHRPSYGTVINRFGSWAAFRTYCADIPRDAVAA